MASIQLKNISKSFGDVKVINDISFTVDKGELISILGASGCGKTTLLRLIAGLEYPDSGQIEINGVVHSIGDKIFIQPENRNIGMVFQNLALWPHLTIFGNVEFGLRCKKFSKKERASKVNKMLELVGIFSGKDRYISELSGGEKQRVALARTLAVGPDVVLFDEPFNSLDYDLRCKIRYEVKNLLKSLKITGIYVTHNRDDAVFMSEKIIMMKNCGIEQFDWVEKVFDFKEICKTCVFNDRNV